MRALVDLEKNIIISWGAIYNSPEFDGIAFDVPDDYSEERYSYIPTTPGVFDPNGFKLKDLTKLEQPVICPCCNQIIN